MLQLAWCGWPKNHHPDVRQLPKRAGLRLLDSHADVALLFIDVVMPDMNGRKLADEALRRRPSLRVIFTTGFSRNTVIHNGVLDKDVNFLVKPFTLEQLTAKVRDVMRNA
jgi:DNA-binding NtrC family response regulator